MKRNFIFFVLLTFNRCFATKENDLVVHFRQFGKCEDVHNPALRFEKMNLQYLGNDTYRMDGEIIAEKEVDGNLKYTLEIEKCTGNGNNDKCKHYLKYIVDDLCTDLKKPRSLTKMYLESSGIPPKCPIMPGNYIIKPQQVGLDDLAKNIVSSGKFWKLHTKIISKNEKSEKVEFCFFCGGEVLKQDQKTRQREFSKSKSGTKK